MERVKMSQLAEDDSVSFVSSSDSMQTLQGEYYEVSDQCTSSNPSEDMKFSLDPARSDSSSVNNKCDTIDNNYLSQSLSSNSTSISLFQQNLSFNRPSSLPETPVKSISSDQTGSKLLETFSENQSLAPNSIGSATVSMEDMRNSSHSSLSPITNGINSLDPINFSESKQLDGTESHISDRSNRSQRSTDNTSITKRRKTTWYSAFSPSYKTKLETFRRVFKDSGVENEPLLVDYACALSKNNNGFLMQGRMYITQNWICFHTKILAFEQKIILAIKDIVSITKERTAKVFPNAIQFEYSDSKEKYFFTSFASRDRTFNVLHKVWQNRCNLKILSTEDFWEQVHDSYGDDLGLTADDDEYLPNDQRLDAKPMLESSVPPPNVDDAGSLIDEVTSASANGSNIDSIEAPPIPTSEEKEDVDFVSLDEEETDQSDTTEDETDDIIRTEVYCKGHEHIGRELVNDVLPITVEELFTKIFTDSEFFRCFCQERKTYDISQSAWPDECDENGEKERTIYYTLSLNNSIGPKTSSSVEKQVLLNCSDSGKIYVIDAKVRNGGIPYCDSFHVVNRYCLTHVSPNSSRLRITSKVIYDKTIFFPARSMIESSAKNGLSEYFRCLVNALIHSAGNKRRLSDLSMKNGDNLSQNISAASNTNHPSDLSTDRESFIPSAHDNKTNPARQLSQKSLGSRRSRRRSGDSRTRSRAPSINNVSNSGGSSATLYESLLKPERAWMLLIVFGLVVCVCISVIYNRFLELERLTQQLHLHHKRPFPDSLFTKTVNSPQDWSHLMMEQRKSQLEEIRRWKNVVETTMKVISQMQSTLTSVRENIETLEQQTLDSIKENVPAS